ncbi:MAG: radical SAM protein [Deltaproteobacteria bacterium]|jgi:hypothetical protein|nr:radical SAM protein [Deltaproteobacteria bacterium]
MPPGTPGDAPGLDPAFFLPPVAAPGPGRRVGMWLRGCSKRCPGCVSPGLWEEDPSNFRGAAEAAKEIMSLARRDQCGGLTVSGGEPHGRRGAPAGLVKAVAPAVPDVLVFSGRPREERELNRPEIRLAACLADGAFEEDDPPRRPEGLGQPEHDRLFPRPGRGVRKLEAGEEGRAPAGPPPRHGRRDTVSTKLPPPTIRIKTRDKKTGDRHEQKNA